MRHTTILTVTDDAGWLEEMRPTLHAMGWGRLVVANSVEEASRLLDVAAPHLIVVQDGDEGPSPERLASLLWANSVLESPAVVVVVSDQYDAERATTLFQLGVDEHLALSEHGDRVEMVLTELAASRPTPRATVRAQAGLQQRARVRTTAGPSSDRVAVA